MIRYFNNLCGMNQLQDRILQMVGDFLRQVAEQVWGGLDSLRKLVSHSLAQLWLHGYNVIHQLRKGWLRVLGEIRGKSCHSVGQGSTEPASRSPP